MFNYLRLGGYLIISFSDSPDLTGGQIDNAF